jgi:hypothetical protein
VAESFAVPDGKFVERGIVVFMDETSKIVVIVVERCFDDVL